MTKVIGVRDLVRNASILEEFDYVDIEDKRTHEYKGLFVSPKYAQEFKKFLEEKISQEIQEQLDEMSQFVGSMEREERYQGLEGKALMEEVAKAKSGR